MFVFSAPAFVSARRLSGPSALSGAAWGRGPACPHGPAPQGRRGASARMDRARLEEEVERHRQHGVLHHVAYEREPGEGPPPQPPLVAGEEYGPGAAGRPLLPAAASAPGPGAPPPGRDGRAPRRRARTRSPPPAPAARAAPRPPRPLPAGALRRRRPPRLSGGGRDPPSPVSRRDAPERERRVWGRVFLRRAASLVRGRRPRPRVPCARGPCGGVPARGRRGPRGVDVSGRESGSPAAPYAPTPLLPLSPSPGPRGPSRTVESGRRSTPNIRRSTLTPTVHRLLPDVTGA